jgi:predicted nucleic acid-binding protein
VIVIDCSAVVDALTAAGDADSLRARMSGEDLHAPALVDFEVVAALRGLVLGKHLTPGRAEDALADFDDLTIERWPSSDGLRRRAFQLRHNVSAYDAAYLALAEALDCPMLTRDIRLRKSAGHHARIEFL